MALAKEFECLVKGQQKTTIPISNTMKKGQQKTTNEKNILLKQGNIFPH